MRSRQYASADAPAGAHRATSERSLAGFSVSWQSLVLESMRPHIQSFARQDRLEKAPKWES